MVQELVSKQYSSIIRLLDYLQIDTESELNISRIKKQVLAEFAIATTGFIEVDGYSYSKNDVLNELESPDFEKQLSFHKIIWKASNLMELLEKNNTYLKHLEVDFKDIPNDVEFDEFLSPFFAKPFAIFSRNLLNAKCFEEMSILLKYQNFILEDQQEIAFQPISQFLEENLRLLRNVSKENYGALYPQIRSWIEGDWYLFFNMLPDEFYDIKDSIIRKLVNMTVFLQKERVNQAKAISRKLIELVDIDQEVRKIILENDKIYNGVADSSSSNENWRWLIPVGVVLIKVITMGGCN